MALKSALPGSPVAMCHQSMVTGSAAAADGAAAEAAALGAPALGGAALAGALLAAPFEQALIVSARTPSNPSVRFGFDMTCPPVIRHSSSGGCGACLVRRSPPDGHPARSIAGQGRSHRKFRSTGRILSTPNLRHPARHRQETFPLPRRNLRARHPKLSIHCAHDLIRHGCEAASL